MTKEELEEKFEDCFAASTRPSEGGYGADTTNMNRLWKSFQPAILEYAKQQVIAFIKDSIQKQILHPTTDETVCIDGIEVGSLKFDLAVSHFYGKFVEIQFIEQQNKPQ